MRTFPATASLRLRLAAAMLVVLVVAIIVSSLIDHVTTPGGDEPYQDGAVLACFSLAVILLIWMVSLWSLRPLAKAAAEVGQAGPEHPGARISADRLPTEVRPLVSSVNAALDRMEAAYEAQRRFTANAAHELRTPLSVLSLRLQRAEAGEASPDWPAINADMRQMTRLVAQLLDLARKEQAGRTGAPAERVNLSRIAREAAATALTLAEEAGRILTVDLPDELCMRGRADDLRDLVLNLLENAIRHGRGGVALRGTREQGRCVLDVTDEGPGVPQEQREAVFERFAKLSANRDGTGLGLAIVREVARSHGGEAGFVAGPVSVVRVTFDAV